MHQVHRGSDKVGVRDSEAGDQGVALITASLATAPLGPYQLQAAIAAVHDEAPSAEDTDWLEILGLYELNGAPRGERDRAFDWQPGLRYVLD